MNHASSRNSLTAGLLATVFLSGLALPAFPAMSQVVIDMPPPPRAETEETDAGVEAGDDDAKSEESEGDTAAEDRDEAGTDEASSAMKPSARRNTNDLGRVALSRYLGARQHARPNDPYWHVGYQPRGRGIGPWGLGHHCAWYGGHYAVAPAVFISGRGNQLFR